MPTYLAESYAPHASASAAAERLRAACRATSEPRRRVRYLHALEVPADELCFYLFSATGADVVEDAVARAGLTHARVTEVIKR